MSRVHAFRDDALADHDAVGLVQALADGRVSAPEVVEAAIARTEDVDPRLGAVAYAAHDRARRAAADPGGGFFAGVPTFVKDNVDVAGMPTQHGTDAFTAAPSRADGDFARMYLATGLLPLGKSRLSEFGFSASAEHPRQGPVRNPWDPSHSSGASSAGAAALVASGAVPIAHANDGGGSIRIPAAATGLVGLKPTRGRLAQEAMTRRMPVRLVADGVLTRSVRDTAAFFREAEKVYRDLSLPPIGDITRPGRARLRIAVVSRSVDRECTDEVRDETFRVAALLEGLGHHVTEVDPPVPSSFPEDFLLYWSMLASYLVRTGRHTFGPTWDKEWTDELTRGLDRHLVRHLHRLPAAVARLAGTRRVSARFHRDHDVVLSPTLAHPTPPLGYLDPRLGYDEVIERLQDWVAFTPWHNASGDPAISLPLGRSRAGWPEEPSDGSPGGSHRGLPLGMMFGAARGREATLLELAYELEEASGFARLDRA